MLIKQTIVVLNIIIIIYAKPGNVNKISKIYRFSETFSSHCTNFLCHNKQNA